MGAGHVFAHMTGERITAESAAEGDAAERGWVDPRWSRREFFESRNDVRPVVSEDLDSEDLADYVREALEDLGAIGVPREPFTPVTRLQARRTAYRGERGWTITGTVNGRRVKVFTPEGGPGVELVKANLRAGRPAFDTSPRQAPATPIGDGTLGTVDQPETTPTGTERPRARRVHRKPYNLRLNTAVVAEAMDRPASGDLSLAELVERLLVEFNEREA